MQTASQVRISETAIRDLEVTRSWLAQYSAEFAERWYEGAVQALQSLTTHPTRCPLAPENDAFGVELRTLLYGKKANCYRILFTIEAQTVTILHVRHAARRFLNSRDAETSEAETSENDD